MTLRDDVARMLMEVPFPSQRTYELVDAIIPLVRAAERERCAGVAYLRKDCATGEMFIATPDELPSGRPSGSVDATPDEKAAAIRNLKDE